MNGPCLSRMQPTLYSHTLIGKEANVVTISLDHSLPQGRVTARINPLGISPLNSFLAFTKYHSIEITQAHSCAHVCVRTHTYTQAHIQGHS